MGPPDQEPWDTQMKRFQPPSHRDGLMILAIVGVFLAGMTARGFLFAAYRGPPTVSTARRRWKDGISVFLERHSERRALIGFVAAADNRSPCFDRDRLLDSLECIVLTPQEFREQADLCIDRARKAGSAAERKLYRRLALSSARNRHPNRAARNRAARRRRGSLHGPNLCACG